MLNKNAHFIYPETIKFDLELKNNNLNIWATRNGLTSDVNLLCGSESRCFQLLCLLVLNKILGYEQRCSFAVLDEMESGLDERSKNIFVGSYINELLQYVQDVIIITPQSHQDFFVEGARELMVKKQKQTSWIEEL
jgi:Fe-S cluster assembly ATPase SufC